MIIGETIITTPQYIPPKPVVEIILEVCKDTEPKPIFCEIPDDLGLKSLSNSGTIQTYTITTSGSLASGYGTSTTTTS